MARNKRDTKKQMEVREEKSFHEELLNQLIALSTAGFGLVAALAWNEAIQGFVKEYVQKYFPDSALYYKFFYALIITVLAVLITYQLSRIAAKIQARKR